MTCVANARIEYAPSAAWVTLAKTTTSRTGYYAISFQACGLRQMK
jgi:hypothetical protein